MSKPESGETMDFDELCRNCGKANIDHFVDGGELSCYAGSRYPMFAPVSAQGSEPSPKELWCDHGNATSMSVSTCTMTPECAARNAPRPVVCDCCGNVLIGVDGHFAEGHAKGCDLANEPSVSTGEVERAQFIERLTGAITAFDGMSTPSWRGYVKDTLLPLYIEPRYAKLEQTIADQKKRIAQLERGEFICKKCYLRKDSDYPKGDF